MIKSMAMGLLSDVSVGSVIIIAVAETFDIPSDTVAAVVDALSLSDIAYKLITIALGYGGLRLAWWSKKQSIRLRQAELDFEREKYYDETGQTDEKN